MTDAVSGSSAQPGAIVGGKYRIDRVIGEGGMGVVLAATHVQLDQRVALKFLLPAVLSRPDIVERFTREARAAVKIQSEHVARVFDVGTLDNGVPYTVMEFLEGEDLDRVVRARGPLSIADTASYVLQACEAIAEAHSLGMIHRDLKPANLFLARRPGGQPIVKVLDFGISKVPLAKNEQALTSASSIMGSPRYMSPEQMLSPETVSNRSDIWSLGVVLYELLTGAVPFQAETIPELVACILQRPHAKIREIRADLSIGIEAVVDRCLEKEPENRYASVAELARALLPFGPPRAEQSVERIEHVLGVPPEVASVATATPLARPGLGAGTFSPATIPEPAPRGGKWIIALLFGCGALIIAGAGTAIGLHFRHARVALATPSATALGVVAPPASVAPAPSVAEEIASDPPITPEPPVASSPRPPEPPPASSHSATRPRASASAAASASAPAPATSCGAQSYYDEKGVKRFRYVPCP